ncbi:MAG TPA: ATP-binding protein [Gemmatimonadales bacterium]|nr:ATP-binding protein [Gemmatimonadales bacterium]
MLEVPQRFDEHGFESFAQAYARAAEASKVIVDAHACEWISPLGFVALLAAGQALRDRLGAPPILTVPSDRDVTHFWARMGFFSQARELFEVHGTVPRVRGGESKVLLEVTPVRVAEDVHDVVHRIQERSAEILQHELGLDARATMGFGMALSEACQNIVEHAGTGGWVAVHTYAYKKRLGRRVAVIAVADAGVGFRHTLETSQARQYGERWGDLAALEAALLRNVSRFRDPGRGQGLAGIRRYVQRWNGKISIRSGTARIAIVPDWDEDQTNVEQLAPFPGAQVLMIIPAAEALDQR